MAVSTSPIRPCLWFDHEAEEAAKFYTSVFPDSSIGHIASYTEAGKDTHAQSPGKTMSVHFTLRGVPFLALNGGTHPGLNMSFTPGISFQIDCADQAEVDHYWSGLLAGGGEESRCGWLKDRFGVSWQVVPVQMRRLIGGEGVQGGAAEKGCKRATEKMMGMKKIVIGDLEEAFEGK